jgi:uncharacterized damage-inducible protein DinB
MNDNSIAREFLLHSAKLLNEEFMPRIRIAVEQLSDVQTWWRPNEASNSIGNLLLHLNGNVSQWILNGVGGKTFARDRDSEFNERKIILRRDLIAQLQSTLDAVDEVLKNVEPLTLLDRKMIQGNEVTVLEAIYHVVEHFSMHTGQILMLEKMMMANDLKLYEFPDGVAKKQW